MSKTTENINAGAPPKYTVSPRQLAANRANSQKSTGPRTSAGKNKSRYNGITHGLTSEAVCIPGESRLEYEHNRQEYMDYFQPQNRIEFDLADDLVGSLAKRRRHRI